MAACAAPERLFGGGCSAAHGRAICAATVVVAPGTVVAALWHALAQRSSDRHNRSRYVPEPESVTWLASVSARQPLVAGGWLHGLTIGRSLGALLSRKSPLLERGPAAMWRVRIREGQ